MKNDPKALSIGILAGGLSTRMGSDKAFLQYKNKSFIMHICEELHEFSEVLISCREPEKFAEIGVTIVRDRIKGFGPLEGIYCLLDQCKNENIFICAVDMPLIKKEIVKYMWENKDPGSQCLVVHSEKGPEPLCAIYHKSVVAIIEKMIDNGEHRVSDLINRIDHQTIRLSDGGFSEDAVKNLNTYQEYCSVVRKGKCGKMFEIREEKQGATIIFYPEGELNLTTSPTLAEKIMEEKLTDADKVIFELEKLEYLSSAGLRVFLKAAKIINDKDRIIIKNANSEIQDIFELAGFANIATIE